MSIFILKTILYLNLLFVAPEKGNNFIQRKDMITNIKTGSLFHVGLQNPSRWEIGWTYQEWEGGPGYIVG